MNFPFASALALPLVCAAALAQAPGAHWSTTSTNTNPSQRRENPGAADSNYMYVFGGKSGASGGAAMNDLWRFDGSTWTEMNTNGAAGAPPARDKAGVTWSFSMNRLIVFGGQDAAGMVLDDVWEWDPVSNTWTGYPAVSGPSARRFTAMTYDPTSGGVLMFGGQDAAGAVLADTWEWDPLTNMWANVTPAGTNPAARRFCALTFDPVLGGVLLFGGLDTNGVHLNDTWAFDGTSWVAQSPAAPLPPVRRQHHLVTRLDYNDVLLFGGQDATLSGSAKWRVDTWRWDGAAWTQIPTTIAPATQVANDAVYDLIRKRVVLASGNGTGGSPSALISEFDCRTNDWIQRPLDTGIYKVSRYFAAYVPALGKTYKVSGQALNATRPPADTYEYQSDTIAAFTSGSAGCAGPAGTPNLISADRPWLGDTLTMSVQNAPATASTFLLIGLNTTSIPLALLGAPSCVVTVDPIVGVPAPTSPSSGLPTLALAIPVDVALVGATLRNQAVVLGAGVVAVSNRGDALFGML